MRRPVLGGMLLIIGTSIGGGMLALPMAVAAGGYRYAGLFFVLAWMVTGLGSLFILEGNLWFAEGANLISMARATLGRWGEAITWFFYLLLLYTLLSAYTAGGSDLLRGLFAIIHLPTSGVLDAILFTIIMGGVLYFGVYIVDRVNRALMSIKLLLYLLLVILIAPLVKPQYLLTGKFGMLQSAVLVVVTAFGYGSIIPTLRSYFKSDVRPLRFAIVAGSFVPLVCYLLWDLVVQGTIPAATLTAMGATGSAVSDLTQRLSDLSHSPWVRVSAHLFTSVCITTSFLGVGLGLTDFIADGLRVQKVGWRLWLVLALTVLPPLFIVILDPAIFISALKFAGLSCAVLLILLPSIVVYRGRYSLRMALGYRVFGGRALVIGMIVIAVLLVLYALFEIIRISFGL